MKVLAVAPHPFFSPRGTPFSVYYRTLVMAEQRVSIDLLTYGEGQDVDISGVRIVRIPRLAWLGPVSVGPSWKKLVLDFFMIAWTIGLLLRYRYHAVHAHEEAVFWCRVLKPLFSFRLIYDMHSSLPQQLSNFKFTKSRVLIHTFRVLENTSLRAADAVVTICPDVRDYVLQMGVDPARHLMIENSIFDDVRLKSTAADDAGSGPSPEVVANPRQPTVFYAGTFEPYQGIDVLVRAFTQVRQAHPQARLLLVGGTPEQVRSIRRLADSLALGESCILTGRVGKADAVRYSQVADVLVSPRLHGTNTPLKVYEHLASGRPLIATRIWSHTQVLDESVCFLVEPDPQSLATGIVAALSDRDEAARRSRNAQALYARAYARPVYEQKIRQLLEIVT